MRIITSACVLLLAAGCHNTGPGGDDQQATASQKAAPPQRASAPPVKPAAPKNGPQKTGEGAVKEVVLSSGAALTLPDRASKRDVGGPGRLPPEVTKAHLFELGGPENLLMVNEMKLGEGKTCDAALDEQLDKANKAKDTPDPERAKFRKMNKVETMKLSRGRALYTVSDNRGVAKDPEGNRRPMITMHAMTLCQKSDYLAIMYASRSAKELTDAKKMLQTMAESYRAPKK